MSSVPRELRSELIYAAAAVNAWLRGLPLPTVALHYRYEPVTALNLIRRCSKQYGEINVESWVPANVLDCALTGGRPPVSVADAPARPPAVQSFNSLPAD